MDSGRGHWPQCPQPTRACIRRCSITVVLFGGQDGAAGLLGDTWAWDGDEWTQVADTGPSPRRGHAMCFEASAQRTVLFGGSDGSDSWAWNGTGWTEFNDVGPPPCEGAALVFTGQRSILFGGTDPTATPAALFGLTWELDGANWTERQDMDRPRATGTRWPTTEDATGRPVRREQCAANHGQQRSSSLGYLGAPR